jgi:predicted TIM-barrel fold metal-dependent hydrolase
MLRAVQRRSFLKGVAAAGAAAVLPDLRLLAQAQRFRIDTHTHFSIPKLYAQATARGVNQAALQDWTAAKMLAQMEEGGVATSIMSISDPGVHFGDNAAARALARECNEFAAKVVADHPGRFGFFAVLPLPDVDGALREAEYALGTLKADGIGVLSSYDGKYLGNPAFAPLLDELNRRRAVVYCHPYCAACGAQQTLTDAQNRGVEFVFDTTRTILSLLQTATTVRCPDIRFIWSHGGGTVPFITSRLTNVAPKVPGGAIAELRKFHYDTAQAFSAYTLPSFKAFVPVSQIVFGTDYPLGGGAAAIVAKGLRDNGAFSAADLRAIERDNALRLLPRLRGGGSL